MNYSEAKKQIKRDKKAILTILADGTKKSFAQISLQGGEGLFPAIKELIKEGKIIKLTGNKYEQFILSRS